jgi:Ni/Co efflux regulator RcnB
MKRLMLSLAAAAAIAGALPSSSAVADERGGHGGRGGGAAWAPRGGERAAWAGPRGGERGVERGGGRWADRPRYEPPPQRRDADGPRGRGNPGRGPGDEGRWEARRADPYSRPAEAPRSYGYRRGAYLPPEGGRAVQDHNAYGLRAPPPGYTWVATPRGYALVNQATGQVFDVVPGR